MKFRTPGWRAKSAKTELKMNPISKINALIGPQRPFGLKAFFLIAIVTAVIDQLTKLAMVATFAPLVQTIASEPTLIHASPPIVLIPDVFQFMFRINTGAAFSSLTGHTGFLTAISVVISLGVVAWACFLKPGEQGMRLSLALIFGGAVGNLVDRFRLGYVVDFIDAHWREVYHWPTFNIADSCICVGIFLLFVTSFTVSQPAAEEAPRAAVQKSSEAS